MSEKITAPWSMEQVLALTRFQTEALAHPFTCPNRHDHPVIFGDNGVLIPTVRGWICQCCDYTQDWAHAFMARYPDV